MSAKPLQPSDADDRYADKSAASGQRSATQECSAIMHGTHVYTHQTGAL